MKFPTSVYLDTNVWLHARDSTSRKHRPAADCFHNLANQNVEINVSSLVFDEIWWKLFCQSYRQERGEGLTSQAYRNDPDVWRRSWPRIRRITEEIRGWARVREVPLTKGASEIIELAASLLDINALAPRDAFHIAVAMAERVPAFVTADRDFSRVDIPWDAGLTIVVL